jgi:hypothetical protein
MSCRAWSFWGKGIWENFSKKVWSLVHSVLLEPQSMATFFWRRISLVLSRLCTSNDYWANRSSHWQQNSWGDGDWNCRRNCDHNWVIQSPYLFRYSESQAIRGHPVLTCISREIVSFVVQPQLGWSDWYKDDPPKSFVVVLVSRGDALEAPGVSLPSFFRS